MNAGKILSELREERDRINEAISALEKLERNSSAPPKRRVGRPKGSTQSTPKKKRRGITAAGRKRLSEMMKKRWADRKKAAKPKGRIAAQ